MNREEERAIATRFDLAQRSHHAKNEYQMEIEHQREIWETRR